ncbi:hypothetical protein CA13_25770 [Planctomycetes bacterium CA13]|uniref:Uncharacterized protein n=1 Tax=Novipirellula herctigrandis TaxID=2527986 RepID=A0A5C5Z1E1_9BACT|nr:hypothetical protein CA13_25770 [Planctomycetes bacterium CA13]
MNRSIPFVALLFLAVLTGTQLDALTRGQVSELRSSGNDSAVEVDKGVPAEALKTEEGMALVQRLRMLRLSESKLGKAHPSVKSIQAEISAVLKQIKSLAPTAEESAGQSRPQKEIMAMSERELRELVLRMAARIEALDARVVVLERHLSSLR